MDPPPVYISSSGEEDDNNIKCPICCLDISFLTLEERSDHVLECVESPKKFVYKSLKKTRAAAPKVKNAPRPKKEKPEIPAVKILKFSGLDIAVDAFCYRFNPEISHYFLSHFHSDHYGGLCKSWNHGTIYCSKLTKILAVTKLKVNPDIIVALDYEMEYSIANGLKVICVDANHCPGSQIFLFKTAIKEETTLHCGDFRVNLNMLSHPLLQCKVYRCYLDTTYLDPVYSFPDQTQVIQTTARYIKSLHDPETHKAVKIQRRITDFFLPPRNIHYPFLIVVGTYTIGKERLAVEIARSLGTKMYASAEKLQILKHMHESETSWEFLKDLLSSNPFECQVHLVSLNKFADLVSYFDQFSSKFEKIIGIKPTGWTYRSTKSSKWIRDAKDDNEILKTIVGTKEEITVKNLEAQFKTSNLAQVYSVPYSEHSSFRELAYFMGCLDIEKVIPTVNLHNMAYLERWIGCIQSFEKMDIAKF
ncbi:unnamed protein product [Kuraishia capsulata CBS 1993]|uniref:DNA repair metallo-beta-lactamase domain-containing protein n=1 Tax=Kuraishia capsulata CBS 1993 TaxID=1382522 RepID=W6MMK3_9ASCO|nr:uncharacterized protein KUCA_T00002138001 [Kuraishia capsulata CBS 1993]CDK26167.1 unnamed protein product [Kuraishia capsulata CBS 1993]